MEKVAMDFIAQPKIVVAICTFHRNEPLANLLRSLLHSSVHLGDRGRIGVVVVDDSKEGLARSVVDNFDGNFALGIEYRLSGKQNISLARNIAIDTASQFSDWTAMIDDDCEPVVGWFEALLQTQRKTGAGAVTGTMIRRAPSGSPRWITEEPFLDLGLHTWDDCARLPVAATFNSMISSQWLRDHPQIRFAPSLGVIGGEDMVFYQRANAAGLRIYYSKAAIVYENQPPSRTTLFYQLRYHFWHGNSSYVTSTASGTRPIRFFVHGAFSLVKALCRPFVLLANGRKPQLRYCLALTAHALGKMIGPIGVRVKH